MSPFRPRPALACAALLLIVAATVSCQGIAPSSTEAEPASVDPDLAAVPSAESAAASTEVEPASVDPDLSTLMLFGESAVAYEEAGERIPAARSFEVLAAEDARPGYRDQGRDRFEAFDPNPVKVAAEEPVSTFSIDVDTASYAFLSVLGFGTGNYNDALMQRLAQNGNGNAAYIDTLSEARKVLVEEATSTLFPIAKDVKIQVEFEPALVSEYRLIGYETRLLAREDFRNDKVDAGEIGAGHTVTAFYEITPVGSGAERIAPLRYGDDEETPPDARHGDEFATVKIRYKLPDAAASTEIVRHMTGDDVYESTAEAPADVRFAAAVAAFGQLLRGGRYTEDYDHDDVIAAARSARGEDPFGYRAEFLRLVRLTKTAASMEAMR